MTAAQRKCLPFLPIALAECWSACELARRAGVHRTTAGKLLSVANDKQRQEIEAQTANDGQRAVTVARRLRDGQIEQAERLEALTESVLESLEAKAEAGELESRDLETLVRLRERHWQHVKDLSGISLAEKVAINRVRGEALGAGIGQALIDATAEDLSGDIWETEVEILPGEPDSNFGLNRI